MSRKNKQSPAHPTRRLGNHELLAKFAEGLDTLQELARVYDGGYTPIALTMANEVNRILIENEAATRLRGSRVFTSPDFGDETKMLNALHRLTGMMIQGDPPLLRFIPNFWMGEQPLMTLDFRTWWNRQPVYRASAALPGTPAGMIPVNDTPSVPFKDRVRVTRRELTGLLRDKLVAHQDIDLPLLIDEINDTVGFGSAVIQTQDGRVFSTDNGSLKTVVGPIAAMMRQIVHELLIAYERSDPAPPQPNS